MRFSRGLKIGTLPLITLTSTMHGIEHIPVGHRQSLKFRWPVEPAPNFPCLVETRTDKHTSAGRPSEIDADQLQRGRPPALVGDQSASMDEW